MPRILFLTAGNVAGQHSLGVGREARLVRAAIATVDPDYADLRVEADVDTHEVVEIVLGAMPDIIHFSGHGEPGKAMFKDNDLPAATISRIVTQVPEIWCVVLNSCFSDTVATRLVNDGVPAVVGMTGEISDEAALDFSKFFYRALAANSDVELAVEQSRVNLLAAYPTEHLTPKVRIGDTKVLAARSRRHARPELRARFCVNDDGSPELWKDKYGTVFVPFDLYIENAPTTATSVIYRLHPSYNDEADDPEDGQFHEVMGLDDKFYLGQINSEDDYTVEAYLRWNDGRARMIKRTVTAALRAHYDALSVEAAAEQKVDRDLIRATIIGLENENLQMPPKERKPSSRSRGKSTRGPKGKRT